MKKLPFDFIVPQVAIERERQIAKGYDPEHDKETHPRGEIALVASVLANPDRKFTADGDEIYSLTHNRKEKRTRRQELIVAITLLFAEVERLDNSVEIKDENGKALKIGDRIGCRKRDESKAESVRGLTLIGYDPESSCPYITDEGKFPLAIKDHNPEMDSFIADHVS